MIHQLQKKLTLFLSAFISIIVVTMTVILIVIITKDYTKSVYSTYIKDTNLLYSYLEQTTIIDANIINEYVANNYYLELIKNNDTIFNTKPFTSEDEFINKTSPYLLKQYWDDYYDATNHNITIQRNYTTTHKNTKYWNSYSIIKINNSYYTAHIIFDNSVVKSHNRYTIIIFCLITSAAIILLSIFAYFFVRQILLPVNTAYQKQDDFIAMASHELKTPLTIIKTCLSGLQNNSNKTSEDVISYIDIANEECNHMTNIINNLLSYADIKQHDKSAFEYESPIDIVIECYNRFETMTIEKQLEFKVDIPDTPLHDVYMDKTCIIQCISILLDNAISCTPDGMITLSVSEKREKLCFQVSDTGPGIPDEEKNKIFDKFHSSRTNHSNHFGLGLSIARNIAELHNASLIVTDNYPSGSVFTLQFN